ncbi:MAG: hypothetical protein IIU14_05950 [Ruminococcus sp.]|nr:hypothetical protein [Ruminococcus sp.]
MKTSKIISGALAAVMVASTLAIGGVSASAATVKKPAKVKAVNTKNSVKITWKKVKGAEKYKVYRGKKVIKTVKNTKYYDKKAKAGKTYKYCVKAVKGSAVSKASKKVKITRLKKPAMTSVASAANGIKVDWKSVKGASKYTVYRKSTGKYAKLATVKTLTYTDTKAVSGTTYSYKVKAVNGKSTSVASDAKSAAFLEAVEAIKPVIDGSDLTLTWGAAKGATAYKVYDENSKLLGTAKDTSFTTTLTKSNISILTYTVVATNGSVKSAAASITFPFVPKGSYFTDKDGNIHAKVTIKAGESYTDGKKAGELVASMTTGTAIEVSQVSGADVATVSKDYTITGVKAGEAQFRVKYNDVTAKLLKSFLTSTNKDGKYIYQNELTTGVAFVDVTVA